MNNNNYYLNPGLPQPVATPLDEPYWAGLRNDQLLVQRCNQCNTWQWGPECICHQCHSSDLTFTATPTQGIVYSYERVWHPVHPALLEQLKNEGAYLVVLVELPQAGNIRMLGNLLGDPHQQVDIGARVEGVYEHHEDAEPVYSLLQWQLK